MALGSALGWDERQEELGYRGQKAGAASGLDELKVPVSIQGVERAARVSRSGEKILYPVLTGPSHVPGPGQPHLQTWPVVMACDRLGPFSSQLGA